MRPLQLLARWRAGTIVNWDVWNTWPVSRDRGVPPRPPFRPEDGTTISPLAEALGVPVTKLLSERTGTVKPFTRIAVIVLWAIALLQLVRFIAGWQITLNGAPVPLWLSGVVAVLAAGLAVMVWRERPR
jgi:hypothetical protein